MKNKDVFVIIPSLDPNEKIMGTFMEELCKNFSNVLVVNDGSNKKHDEFFESLEKKKIIVLKNHINYGKGRSLKSALNYILNNYPEIKAIVTADCDGQHSVDDIEKVADSAKKHKKAYVLGTRDFDKSNVPLRSKFGNKITRNVFKIFLGLNITDTQTGLRGMSFEVAKKFLATKGERYEYETNTLIETKDKNIPIVEEIIETIYINGNEESHFNPFKDSLSIYKLFFKYIVSAGSSFVIDIVLFSLFLNLFKVNNGVLFATIAARIISSIYNFAVNAKFVFKNQERSSIFKYIALVIFQMFASAFIVNYLSIYIFEFAPTLIKIIVDTIIFIVNFIVQREWVFKKK